MAQFGIKRKREKKAVRTVFYIFGTFFESKFSPIEINVTIVFFIINNIARNFTSFLRNKIF
jgi:hypothetical protein